MEEPAGMQAASTRRGKGERRSRILSRAWKRIRKPLGRSRIVKAALVELMAWAIRFIGWTNPPVPGENEIDTRFARHAPAIIALWHGQHIMVPVLSRKEFPAVGLFSRSADAELNARVAEKLGLGVVRGSGGRDGAMSAKKGGAEALLALRRALAAGKSAAIIADIAHGTPREAGLGIVTLAKISGRPIIPVAYASSRRKVLEKTWDRTTISLPFGRSAVVIGDPIRVSAEADAAEMEDRRREVTAGLNSVTTEADRRVDERS